MSNNLPLWQAFTQGTTLAVLRGIDEQAVTEWLVAEIFRTCQYLECKNTITSVDDAIELAEELERTYPTMKAEEFAIVFKNMRMQRYGKYYERLKAGEFLECFLTHDGSEERSRMFVEINTEGQKEMKEKLPEIDYDKIIYTPQKKRLSDNFTADEKRKRQQAMAEHIMQTPKEQNDLDAENHEPTSL